MSDSFIKFDTDTPIQFLNPPGGELLNYAPRFKVHYSKEKGCLVHTVDESEACLFCTLQRFRRRQKIKFYTLVAVLFILLAVLVIINM